MKLALRALAKLSAEERTRYEAFRQSTTEPMHWAEASALSPEQRDLLTNAVLRARYVRAQAIVPTDEPPVPSSKPPRPLRPRLLNAFCLAYLRKKLTETAPVNDIAERLREITWSVEHGALARLEVRLAMNVALKKLRQGQWTRPNRMPPNWQLSTRA